MDERLYPGVNRNWDDCLFRKRILDRLESSSLMLDLGAGAGVVEQMNFRGIAARVCGVDPDPRVTANHFLDEGKEGVGEKIPYDDETFDLVVADNVIEHLPHPMIVFAEVARVLKSGGSFLFKTPNRRHYMPIVAQMTPYWFHQYYNRLRGRAAVDTFPTYYRANSPRAIHRLAQATGMEVRSVELIEGRPEYMRVTPATYLVGWLYERAVNSIPHLEGCRVLIIASLRKTG